METLSRRALNRATLTRQHLLERVAMPAAAMVEHLVGMQAQVPRNPYLALWSRLSGFRAEELEGLMLERRAVRGGLMRATIHLVTAPDWLVLRPVTQPVLDRVFTRGNIFGRNLVGLDVDAVADAGRALVEEKPRSGTELRRLLAERWPDRDPASLAAAVTARLAVVQVTPRGLWHTSSQPAWTTTEAWLGRPVRPGALPLDDLVLRYLAAFGPASVLDMQSWCGLSRLREVADRLRPHLRVVRDDEGRELLDLPDAPRPDPDTPAPVRLLPEYDNVLLGHADRSRFLGPERGPAPEGVNSIQGSVLVDGLLAAWWNLRRPEPGTAHLVVRPFRPWTPTERAEVEDEGGRLLGWVAPDDARREVVLR